MARVLKQEEVSRKQAAISVGYVHGSVVSFLTVAARIVRLSAKISVKLRLDPDPIVFNPESRGSEVFGCV